MLGKRNHIMTLTMTNIVCIEILYVLFTSLLEWSFSICILSWYIKININIFIISYLEKK